MLPCIWPVLNLLSIHATFTAIVPAAFYPGEPSFLFLILLLSRVSTLTRDIDIAIMSVCLSVCPSVHNTLVLYENGLTYRHSFFSPYGSPIILVLPASYIFTGKEGREWKGGKREEGMEWIGEEGEEGKGGKNPPNKKTGYGAGWRERRRREGREEPLLSSIPSISNVCPSSQNPLKYAV